MVAWVAVSYGALNVADRDLGVAVEVLALPIYPGEPQGLIGTGSRLWRRLIAEGPIADSDLSEEELVILTEMHAIGLASNDTHHPARVRRLDGPWLSSPWHELVYALIANLADRAGIPAIFIKGPVLRKQGLRDREHSGDVDVWVPPGRATALGKALEPWGWDVVGHEFADEMYHSVTLRPRRWGCEIDVHFRFPGIVVPPERAFDILSGESEHTDFAGVECATPKRGAHSVIHALHHLRPQPGQSVSRIASQHATEALRRGNVDAVRVAVSWRAYAALASTFARALPGAALPVSDEVLAPDWRSRNARSRAEFHLKLIGTLPWWKRPQALIRAAWPTQEAALRSAALHGYTEDSPSRARVRRLVYGLRALTKRSGH